MVRLCPLGLVAALLAALPVLLPAQAVNGSLVGTVTDVTGASAPSARVTITEVNTGVSRAALTNESGNYARIFLPERTRLRPSCPVSKSYRAPGWTSSSTAPSASISSFNRER